MNDLQSLEAQFWKGNADFYDHHLSRDAVMVFPLPTGILQRDEILASLQGGPRWEEIRMESASVHHPTADTVCLTYLAHAARDDRAEPYRALVASLYVWEEGHWRLAFHQQTPC